MNIVIGFLLGVLIGLIVATFTAKPPKGQIIVNQLSVQQAFKFFLMREEMRHKEDIAAIERDLFNLRDIHLPPGLDLYAWYVVPEKGTNVPKPGTYPKREE